ncbi:MAG: putative transporter substrate binding protein, partial [Pseudonocardiales bacterium]|nr:putative transporter substrate binding protein [Pseudonocardiales bacterium]
NEVNKLIWPSTDGIGMVDTTTWDQTITVAKTTKNDKGEVVLKGDPSGLAYTNDYTEKALAALKAAGEDTTGSKFSPITVTLNKGGS